MERVDAVVVGAGVVGLAVARCLALKGFETLILEAETGYGAGVSSRNSEVIHAGLYYPEGSLKAALCVEGRRRLYDYCAARRIPHRRTEKLVFAAHDGQLEALEVILARLKPGYAGIRPKLSGPGEPVADFMISGPADHGLQGLVNLFGIESPGLTASLAIAERVGALLTTSSHEAS
ncbi:MAG TPA: FAD-dependent oxidoreductase [Steroidobacteraceae bacterium]|nr:FAD-dependent oxidoreductase [Steroidobacteraceae bacterium]